jgi:capsular exopolysaccharide synthesis family protein
VDGEQSNMSIEQVLGVLRRRAPLIVLCVLLAAGVAYGLSKRQASKYTATGAVVFSNNPLSQQIVGLPVVSSNPLTQEETDVELVKLGDMAVKTAQKLGRGLTAQTVDASLSVGAQGESGVVAISATAGSPTLAAAIVNSYAEEFVKEQQGSNRSYFRSALALVNKQLFALPPQQRFGVTGAALQDRAQMLRLLSELDYGNVRVAQEASVPTVPSSPHPSRSMVIGGLSGLLIGVGLAFLLERFDRDRWIRKPEDLEQIYHLPLLGAVRKSASLASASVADGHACLSPREAETFHLIRARTRSLAGGRSMRMVLIASVAPGEGKTTIALHFAGTAAVSGARVLLLEANLRHPVVGAQLGIHPAVGLTDVLSGAVTLDQATHTVDLTVLYGAIAAGQTLEVLTAGGMPSPNPSALMESQAMRAMLAQAKPRYDLVVIDTPPFGAFSDGFALMDKVDGVIVVGWAGRNRRESAERLHQILRDSGAPLLGVVANGARSKDADVQYYSSGSLVDGALSVAVGSENGSAPKQPRSTAHV